MRKSRVLCLSLILLAAFLFVFQTSRTHASNASAGVLKIEYENEGPLFNAVNIAPGYSETKILTVTNTGKVPHSLSIAASGLLGKLAEKLTIEFKDYETGSLFWKKELANIALPPKSDLIVGSIAAGETKKIAVTASLPINTGNEYMDTTTFSFGFVVGNESTDQKEPVILSENEIAGINQAVSSYIPIVSDPAGIADQASDDNGQIGEENNLTKETVKGESTGKIYCFWWWLLLLIFALVAAIYGYFAKIKKFRFPWVIPSFVAAFLYPIHWIIDDFYTKTKWCEYFLFMDIGILALFLCAIYLIRPKEENKKQKRR